MEKVDSYTLIKMKVSVIPCTGDVYKRQKQWYFMEEKYPELGNLMPRDITAREIWKVSHESEVFLDMTEISEEIISNKLSGPVSYTHLDVYKRQV